MMEHLTDISIIEFTAGNLSEEASQSIRRHISACPQCRAKVEDFGLDWEALGQWEQPALAKDMTADIHKLINSQASGQPGSLMLFLHRFAFRSAAIVLFGAAIGFIAGKYIGGSNDLQQPVVPEYMQSLSLGYASELTWAAMEEGYEQGAEQ